MTCPDCEYHKARAAHWRREAYKAGGSPLPGPDPLTDEEIDKAYQEIWRDLPDGFDHTSAGWIELAIRYAERAHGIGVDDDTE